VLCGGLAMPATSFLLDTVPKSLAEFLHARGWDLWLLDWRTTPALGSFADEYSLSDGWELDWPAAIEHVCRAADVDAVSVFAHCMGAATFMRALYEGHVPPSRVRSVVCSQTCLFVRLNATHRTKSWWGPDRVVARSAVVHFDDSAGGCSCADCAVSCLSCLIPRTYSCSNGACHKQSVVFGDLLRHENLSERTHSEMPGPLVPAITMGIVKDVAKIARASRNGALIPRPELGKMANLAVPITIVSGALNECIVPQASRDSLALLSEYNGEEWYRLHIVEGYGHLDSLIGDRASKDVFPLFLEGLERRD
jgi:cholesterol oxidase